MNIQENIPLAPYTTFGIGGPADFFVKAQSANELIDSIKYAKKNNLDFFLIGTGANILIGDKGFRGLVIKNESSYVDLSESEGFTFVSAESGVIISELIGQTLEKGLSGFEHFAGIPSTVGGALWQNLHLLNQERNSTIFIGDILYSAIILSDKSESQLTVKKDYFRFGYDESILHHNRDIVLSAKFALKREDPKVIQKRIDANLKWREEKHPDYAWRVSAGSVFKKIEGYGAGRLIERVGLKGFSVGGAQISPKHANFIINANNAKAMDVKELIHLTQKKVKKELGLDLITEISFVGGF